MKGPIIKDIIITPIATVDPPLLNAAGLHAPYALRTIVEIVTDDNIIGISEIPGTTDTNEALEKARELIVGKDAFQLNQIRDAIESHFDEETTSERGDAPWDQRKIVHVFSAIEVACLDIQGKVLGRSVVDLLGGKRRDRVPFAAYLFYKYEGAGGELAFGTDPKATGWDAARQVEATTPDGIVAQAIAMVKEFGFKSIKLKGGAFPPMEEVAAMQALYEYFGPDVPLRLDPNAIWKLETAIEYGKMMEGILEYFEDPVRGQEDMAKARKALKMPLATNMCTTSFEDIPGSIAMGSEDIILSDHHFWGGLRSSMELAKLCQTFGRKLSMHSNSHLGISLAAMVHLGAALPEVPYALDTHYPWQSEEVIAGGRMQFEGGAVQVPTGPGLGVEIDQEALKKLHQNYLKCGLTRRDDLVEMRKVIPDWEFKKVRW
ncbi:MULTISPECIES: enolase C-terminal domain-like protein [unclassified Imperialibacter]|uniref:enolase C-terminal domain-like protein n=1 Tax=unclassified Imperialibacter TaxID=2629706 RepID=UPI0012568084|nr:MULTISPECIES: enolase C-terminal domain-like protein [unclassified Imperialibacter]CAD5251991.1 putative glucarate dehydratase [Imperialibacter sp. 89]CAD5265092.1 putative glucarate dehydratase [Imperialibacter sp. 75]VVT03339.1 putative glucarate dehydratase [Imperialibacter sp. EC-SDR9]